MYASKSASEETEDPGNVSLGFKDENAAVFMISRVNLMPEVKRAISKGLERTLLLITGGANGSVVFIETLPRLKGLWRPGRMASSFQIISRKADFGDLTSSVKILN